CIGLFLSRLYPNRMSKTLLLCPMSMQQKKQYIRTGFVIRVVFPYGLFLLLEGATMLVMLNHRLVHASEIVLWAAKAWILLLSLISVNIYCQPIDPIPYVMGRKYRLPGNYEIWNILVQLLAIFGGMILGSAITDQKSETVFDIVVDLILVAIITALCIKIIVTYAGPVMEQAVSCEYRPRLEKERKRG
ncbi:MAG: hypothetical protein J6P60_01115, partial [Lachnospiraceae bacterium]|nr:hypothetical protein [Lachnospiraceae bacterium]